VQLQCHPDGSLSARYAALKPKKRPLKRERARNGEVLTHWQRGCNLDLRERGVLTVSMALELALFMDAKLDVSKLQ